MRSKQNVPATYVSAAWRLSALMSFNFLCITLCAPALGGPTKSITVLLFGQPCELSGKESGLTEKQLRALHQISPEQTPSTESIATLKSSIERLKSTEDVPDALAHYRHQRSQFLKNRLKFEEALAAVHQNGQVKAFADTTRDLLPARRHPALIKKLEAALRSGPSVRAWESVRESFIDYSGPDGEETFHRILRRMKIQYQCTFEEERDEEHVEPSSTTR
ncbi:MAG: hypothetical protein RJB38_362 [Pseudomonadota bacterium]|jgi:hypothetical protein